MAQKCLLKFYPFPPKMLNIGKLLITPWILRGQMVKHLPTMWETQVRTLGWEDPLEKEMATHSSTLAWKIPWTEEPGRLQSIGSQRVRHDWATSLELVFHCITYYLLSSPCYIKTFLFLREGCGIKHPYSVYLNDKECISWFLGIWYILQGCRCWFVRQFKTGGGAS